MEKILVGIDTKNIDMRPCIHAISLAERMKRAKVYFLLVSDESKADLYDKDGEISNIMFSKKLGISAKKDLESLIEDGRSKGIVVDYYTAQGDFRNEIVDFIKTHRIDLLVIGYPQTKMKKINKEAIFTEFIEKIQHRVDCRIEVVHGRY